MEKIHNDGFFICILENRNDFFRYKLKVEGYYENDMLTATIDMNIYDDEILMLQIKC